AHAIAQRHAGVRLGIPRWRKIHELRSVALVPWPEEGHMRLEEVDVERERRARALLDVLVEEAAGLVRQKGRLAGLLRQTSGRAALEYLRAIRRTIRRLIALAHEPLVVGREAITLVVLDVAILHARPPVEPALGAQLVAQMPLAGIPAVIPVRPQQL